MTIRDLASKTGYSVGTVSRVLNNKSNVSQEARDAIWEAANACGFHLNVNAKQLKQSRSNTVLVMIKGRFNELFSMLLETIQQCVAETPYVLTVTYVDEEDNEVSEARRLTEEIKPAGILFLGGNQQNFHEEFEKISCPCVLVTNDGSALPFRNLSSVCSDNRAAARMAVEYLVGLGHRRIGIVGGDRGCSDTASQRFCGCMDAIVANGLDFDDAQDYRTVRCSYAEGYRGAREIIRSGRSCTALFVMADVAAIGAIRALEDAGMRVPEDVSVVGFDGLPIGAYTTPRLATVSQSTQIIGRRSVEILLQQMENGGEPVHERIPVAPVWRESVRGLSSD